MQIRLASRIFPSLLAVCTALLPIPVLADTIAGRVVNRTLSQPVPGCEVALIRHGAASTAVERDTTDGEGRFRFEVPAGADTAQTHLSVSYAGVDYLHPVTGNSGETELPVYDITDADTALSVVSHHIVVDGNADEITQILVVRNSGNRTYRTGEGHGHGLEVPLPEGVSQISSGPQGLHTHGNVLVDPRPVKPGNSQLAFAHPLPSTRRLVQEIVYPTGSIDVLVHPADTPVSGPGLQDMGEVAFGQRNFHRFSGTVLKPGDRIDLQIGGAAPAGWASRGGLKWTLGGLALALAVLAVLFRPRKGADAPADAPDRLASRRDALMEQIADLDDRFANGEVSEADYRTRRDALKAEVVQLTRALDSTEA